MLWQGREMETSKSTKQYNNEIYHNYNPPMGMMCIYTKVGKPTKACYI